MGKTFGVSSILTCAIWVVERIHAQRYICIFSMFRRALRLQLQEGQEQYEIDMGGMKASIMGISVSLVFAGLGR